MKIPSWKAIIIAAILTICAGLLVNDCDAACDTLRFDDPASLIGKINSVIGVCDTVTYESRVDTVKIHGYWREDYEPGSGYWTFVSCDTSETYELDIDYYTPEPTVTCRELVDFEIYSFPVVDTTFIPYAALTGCVPFKIFKEPGLAIICYREVE